MYALLQAFDNLELEPTKNGPIQEKKGYKIFI